MRVGRAPLDYLTRFEPDRGPHRASLLPLGLTLNAPLTRGEVRGICRDPACTAEAKYACVMAWGGQQFNNFDSSIAAPALVPLIQALFGSANTRAADFATAQAQSAAILGLGISFYTKLLFFLRPATDAYSLDQWTAKSITLLQSQPIIHLTRPANNGFCRAEPNTTPNEYEAFCRALDAMSAILWPKSPGASGEDVEMAMFDRNLPDGFWRGFVRVNFTHPVSGDLLFRGAESLTRALDYRAGLLVLKFGGRLHVISITTHCCQWSQEDSFRFLLSRLHELTAEHGLPVTLVLPPGSALCPDWFKEANNHE